MGETDFPFLEEADFFAVLFQPGATFVSVGIVSVVERCSLFIVDSRLEHDTFSSRVGQEAQVHQG